MPLCLREGRFQRPWKQPEGTRSWRRPRRRREARLYEQMQYTLRGPTLAALPFFDRDKVVALLDELPSLDEGGRTAYDPALMILLSACTLHARYGLSGTDKRCSTSELGDAIVQRRAREYKGASSRPCDARSLSWRVRNRSCIVGTIHRSPGIRPVGCTHPTGSIRACGRGGNRDVPRIGRNAPGSASS